MSDEPLPGDRKPTPSVMGAIPPWAAEMHILIRDGLQRVNERLVAMDANIDLQGDTVRDVAKRMTALEERQNTLEARANNNSERAKSAAVTDDKHDAAIAMLHTKLDDNTAKTEQVFNAVLEIKKWSEHPMVKRAAYLVLLALISWLTAHAKGVL